MTQDKLHTLTAVMEKALEDARAGQRLLAAVSGGADSVCLLLCASALQKKGYSVTAAHVRHDLRETAGRDEAFVQELCGQLAIPFRSVSVHVPRSGSTEEQARIARYQALEQIFREEEADVLLLAHHQGDQAETVLMRLIRGCGAEGLSAMRNESVRGSMTLLRPFLTVSAEEIRAALRETGQPWCEDETNTDLHYTRNYLRHRILSPLEETMPGSIRGICRSAEILGEENDFLNQVTEKILKESSCLEPPCRFLLREKLEVLHPALQRRLIRRFLEYCGTEAGFDKTEEIRKSLPDPPSGINLDGGGTLMFSEQRIHYVPANPVHWTVPDGFFSVISADDPGDGKTCQAFPLPLYENCVVRFPQPGDVFQPFSHRKEMRLSRCLIDRKIDRPFRPFIPLICRENVVLWIAGVAASEQLRLKPAEPSVTLAVRGRLPWEIRPAV